MEICVLENQTNADLKDLGVTDEPENEPKEQINVQKWLNRINKGREKEQTWRRRAKNCIKIYRDEHDNDNTTSNNINDASTSFNILWANVETLLPALFSAVPKPDIRNRYLNQDKIAEAAGQVIERTLTYSLDLYNFARLMKAAIKDYLLTGRCVMRVRLIPEYENLAVTGVDDDGLPVQKMEEQLVGQAVRCELVHWDAFVVEPCKRWEDVNWIAFIHMLSKKEFDKYFPDAPMVSVEKEVDKYGVDPQYQVYEIWDKVEKKVYFIGQADEALEILDDPLKLQHFWPIPEPLYSIQTNDSLVPIPEYTIYQAQAYELNEISYRITDLVTSCKFVGVYDAQQTGLSDLLTSRDSQIVPVTGNLLRQGGINSVIDTLDTSPISKILGQLYTQREQIKGIIYEVTGISDIIRGESKASETATAQNIKAQYAGLRLRDRRDNINRFIVDLLRIKAELISTFFSEKQLSEMSGVKLDFSNEQEPVRPQPPMQMGGMPIPPELIAKYEEVMKIYSDEMKKRKDAEAVMQLLRDDVLQSYKIDIESDSTILADMQQLTQERSQLVASVTQFLTAVSPLVAQGALPIETAKALLNFALSSTKITRELQDAIDLIGTQPPPQAGMGMPPGQMPMPPQGMMPPGMQGQLPPQGLPPQMGPEMQPMPPGLQQQPPH